MFQESQSITATEGAPEVPEGIEDTADSRQRPLSSPETEHTAISVDEGAERPLGPVVLDEANDLLVITEAGALLSTGEDVSLDPMSVSPAVLSETAASWAKQVLAIEAESSGTDGQAISPLASGCVAQAGGDGDAFPTVDWIDW